MLYTPAVASGWIAHSNKSPMKGVLGAGIQTDSVIRDFEDPTEVDDWEKINPSGKFPLSITCFPNDSFVSVYITLPLEYNIRGAISVKYSGVNLGSLTFDTIFEVPVKFGEKTATRHTLLRNGSSRTVHFKDWPRTLAAIRSNDYLQISLDLYNYGPTVFIYDITGASDMLDTMMANCRNLKD